jgi:hypothetical protein
MVSSLTTKDDDVVNLLCSYFDTNSPCTTVFHALEVRLRAAMEAMCHDSIDGLLSDSTTVNTVSAQRVATSSLVNAVSIPSWEKGSGIVTIQDPDAVRLAILNMDYRIPVIVQLLSHSDMEKIVMALHLVNALQFFMLLKFD